MAKVHSFYYQTMIQLDKENIRNILPRIRKGLQQYVAIQSRLNSVDVSEDVDFQKMFTAFYRVRRNKEWRTKYFSILQTAKRERIDFREALKQIHQQTGRIEASFASKLVATIDPRLPVIDSIVMHNVGVKLPYYGAKNREEIIVRRHAELRELLEEYLKTPEGKSLVTEFRSMYPYAQISPQKMLDFVLWQKR
jgi:hypothetical protein